MIGYVNLKIYSKEGCPMLSGIDNIYESLPIIILSTKAMLPKLMYCDELRSEIRKLGVFAFFTCECDLRPFDGKANIIAVIPDDDTEETAALYRFLFSNENCLGQTSLRIATNNTHVLKDIASIVRVTSGGFISINGAKRSILEQIKMQLRIVCWESRVRVGKFVLFHPSSKNDPCLLQRVISKDCDKSGTIAVCTNDIMAFVMSASTKVFVAGKGYPQADPIIVEDLRQYVESHWRDRRNIIPIRGNGGPDGILEEMGKYSI
jgi:hypothetical protein